MEPSSLPRLQAQSDDVLKDIAGGLSRDGSTLRASALQLIFFIQNERIPISGKSDDDPIAVAWEEALGPNVRDGFSNAALNVHVVSQGEVDVESERAIVADVALLSVGYTLIIMFATSVFWRPNTVYSRSMLAMDAVMSVVIAIGSALGLCLFIGIKFNMVVQSLAVVLLGIGIDDGFVISAAYLHEDPALSIRERMSAALRHAGSSITVTSLTDVSAFLTGISSQLPALRNFCFYAVFGVFFDFVYQVTFFVACMVIDAKRQVAGRRDVFCCFIVPKEKRQKRYCSEKPFDETEDSPTQIAIGYELHHMRLIVRCADHCFVHLPSVENCFPT